MVIFFGSTLFFNKNLSEDFPSLPYHKIAIVLLVHMVYDPITFIDSKITPLEDTVLSKKCNVIIDIPLSQALSLIFMTQ